MRIFNIGLLFLLMQLTESRSVVFHRSIPFAKVLSFYDSPLQNELTENGARSTNEDLHGKVDFDEFLDKLAFPTENDQNSNEMKWKGLNPSGIMHLKPEEAILVPDPAELVLVEKEFPVSSTARFDSLLWQVIRPDLAVRNIASLLRSFFDSQTQIKNRKNSDD